jgi:hypothetical protein
VKNRGLTANSTTSPKVITDTATAHPPSLAAPTPAPHLPRPTNQAANRANTDSSKVTTATVHLHRDSTAQVPHHTRAKVAMAMASTEARRNNMAANNIREATDHRLASVDKVGTAMVHHLADTDSKQAMVVQHRVTTAAQEITTTTSTTRYVL